MIVFNLGCGAGHRFEGWFGSAEDFERQNARGMLQCPVCADKAVARLPSAPRLNLAGGGDTPAPAAGAPATGRERMLDAQAEFYRHLRRMLERSEDVGERFSEEARRIHYKEIEARQIHGVATPEQAVELIEEGIAVLPLPGALKRKGELN